METKPTHEQAQLHLQVYDLRREARLRQARDWFSVASFSACGSYSSRSFLSFASGLLIRTSSRIWKGPPNDTKPGPSNARLVMLPL